MGPDTSPRFGELNTKQFQVVLNNEPLLMLSTNIFMRLVIVKPIGKILAEAKDLQRGSGNVAKERHPFRTKSKL